MEKFEYLKQFVTNESNQNIEEMENVFYKLSDKDIQDAESRIGIIFPQELRNFYLEIGYGFLCNKDKNNIDRLMDPASVADFKLGEGIHEFDPDRELFNIKNSLVFFEVFSGTYLFLDIGQINNEGICPVYYFDDKIANSIEQFILKMKEKCNYFL